MNAIVSEMKRRAWGNFFLCWQGTEEVGKWRNRSVRTLWERLVEERPLYALWIVSCLTSKAHGVFYDDKSKRNLRRARKALEPYDAAWAEAEWRDL